jgi:hypothetical protein
VTLQDPNDDLLGSEPGPPTGTPRWVKVFGAIAVIVLALFFLVLLVRGGEHGPSRHSPADDGDRPAGHTGPPETVTHP